MSDANPKAATERTQELPVSEKQEVGGEEKTIPGRFFVPTTDAYETDQGLILVMEMAGVSRENLDVSLEEGVLRVEGRLDPSRYAGHEPVYTEYNIGHYARSFSVSDKIDREKISARLENGVLTLTLPRSPAALPRRIAIG